MGFMLLVWNKFGGGVTFTLSVLRPVPKKSQVSNPTREARTPDEIIPRKEGPTCLPKSPSIGFHVIWYLIPSKSIFRDMFLWMSVYPVGKWKAHVRAELVLTEGKIMIFRALSRTLQS